MTTSQKVASRKERIEFENLIKNDKNNILRKEDINKPNKYQNINPYDNDEVQRKDSNEYQKINRFKTNNIGKIRDINNNRLTKRDSVWEQKRQKKISINDERDISNKKNILIRNNNDYNYNKHDQIANKDFQEVNNSNFGRQNNHRINKIETVNEIKNDSNIGDTEININRIKNPEKYYNNSNNYTNTNNVLRTPSETPNYYNINRETPNSNGINFNNPQNYSNRPLSNQTNQYIKTPAVNISNFPSNSITRATPNGQYPYSNTLIPKSNQQERINIYNTNSNRNTPFNNQQTMTNSIYNKMNVDNSHQLFSNNHHLKQNNPYQNNIGNSAQNNINMNQHNNQNYMSNYNPNYNPNYSIQTYNYEQNKFINQPSQRTPMTNTNDNFQSLRINNQIKSQPDNYYTNNSHQPSKPPSSQSANKPFSSISFKNTQENTYPYNNYKNSSLPTPTSVYYRSKPF
jgi:hypothetical protein